MRINNIIFRIWQRNVTQPAINTRFRLSWKTGRTRSERFLQDDLRVTHVPSFKRKVNYRIHRDFMPPLFYVRSRRNYLIDVEALRNAVKVVFTKPLHICVRVSNLNILWILYYNKHNFVLRKIQINSQHGNTLMWNTKLFSWICYFDVHFEYRHQAIAVYRVESVDGDIFGISGISTPVSHQLSFWIVYRGTDNCFFFINILGRCSETKPRNGGRNRWPCDSRDRHRINFIFGSATSN